MIAWVVANLMFYILIILVIMVVIFILINIMSSIQINQTIDNVDEEEFLETKITDIHQIDLNLMLSESISSGNYKMAIRAKFLMLLKSLSNNDKINWSIEKTNRDYIRETRSKPFSHNFQYLANLFDQVWYGEIKVDQETFNQMAPYFEDLTSYINNNVESV